jgi:hypothetical protein
MLNIIGIKPSPQRGNESYIFSRIVLKATNNFFNNIKVSKHGIYDMIPGLTHKFNFHRFLFNGSYIIVFAALYLG